jgi:hypothetical protein
VTAADLENRLAAWTGQPLDGDPIRAAVSKAITRATISPSHPLGWATDGR